MERESSVNFAEWYLLFNNRFTVPKSDLRPFEHENSTDKTVLEHFCLRRIVDSKNSNGSLVKLSCIFDIERTNESRPEVETVENNQAVLVIIWDKDNIIDEVGNKGIISITNKDTLSRFEERFGEQMKVIAVEVFNPEIVHVVGLIDNYLVLEGVNIPNDAYSRGSSAWKGGFIIYSEYTATWYILLHIRICDEQSNLPKLDLITPKLINTVRMRIPADILIKLNTLKYNLQMCNTFGYYEVSGYGKAVENSMSTNSSKYVKNFNGKLTEATQPQKFTLVKHEENLGQNNKYRTRPSSYETIIADALKDDTKDISKVMTDIAKSRLDDNLAMIEQRRIATLEFEEYMREKLNKANAINDVSKKLKILKKIEKKLSVVDTAEEVLEQMGRHTEEVRKHREKLNYNSKVREIMTVESPSSEHIRNKFRESIDCGIKSCSSYPQPSQLNYPVQKQVDDISEIIKMKEVMNENRSLSNKLVEMEARFKMMQTVVDKKGSSSKPSRLYPRLTTDDDELDKKELEIARQILKTIKSNNSRDSEEEA